MTAGIVYDLDEKRVLNTAGRRRGSQERARLFSPHWACSQRYTQRMKRHETMRAKPHARRPIRKLYRVIYVRPEPDWLLERAQTGICIAATTTSRGML
ncbi:MAG TPA: hypothetical protein DEP84_34795 [Chloroflexi bacterium]|nr:hypothetical protein [Chloroflexota bacterium]